jgi:hypothetical protein
MKLRLLTEDVILERIKKIGPKKWRVLSKKGKNLGTSSSRKGAVKRLGEVEFFKSQK